MITVALIMIALDALAFALPTQISNESFVECHTHACKSAANNARQLMDPTVDPCEDFYEYACGRFLRDAKIPSNRVEKSSFSDIKDKVNAELLTLIRKPIELTDARSTTMAKKYFSECMNYEAREAIGLKPLLNLIHKMGGWPMVSDANEDKPIGKWYELADKFVSAGVQGDLLVTVNVVENPRNRTQRVIHLAAPSFPITNNELRILIKSNIILRVAAELGAVSGRRLEKETEEVVKFLEELISIPKSESFFFITVSVLQILCPFTNWLDYINLQLPHGIRVNSSDKVVISNVSYLNKIGKIIDQTPNRVIANFMVWVVVKNLIQFTNKKLISLHNNFTSILNGNKNSAPDYEVCLELTKDNFGLVLDAMYVREHFDVETRDAVTDMVNRLRYTMAETFRSDVRWMDPLTKGRAEQKLKSMGQVVGYPDQLLVDSKLEREFDGVNLERTNFFENSMELKAFQRKREMEMLQLPIDDLQNWIKLSVASTVNAHFFNDRNTIDINAAILQGQYFAVERPNYINYASIGAVIGHEINHGFDSEGRQYDENGNLADWWEPNTACLFQEKTSCLLNQYGNFTDPFINKHLNANLTLGDDIADNEGVRAAYKTYLQWTSTMQPEPRLPGLDLTPNQLFWLSYGQMWCRKTTTEYAEDLHESDHHSTNRYRVIGPLQNNKQFAKDFECPIGSSMNPETKCSLWQ